MDSGLAPLARPGRTAPLCQHPQRVQVGFQNRFLLLALVDVLLAHTHHRAQRFYIEAVALGLGIDVTHVIGDRLLFFLQPLDALNEGLELILGETMRGLFVFGGGGSGGGGSSGHQLLLSDSSLRRTTAPARSPAPEARSLFAKAFEVTRGAVKAPPRSSTALHSDLSAAAKPQCFWLAFSKAAFRAGEDSF